MWAEKDNLPADPDQVESRRIMSGRTITRGDLNGLATNFEYFYARRATDDAMIERMEKDRRRKIILGAALV